MIVYSVFYKYRGEALATSDCNNTIPIIPRKTERVVHPTGNYIVGEVTYALFESYIHIYINLEKD